MKGHRLQIAYAALALLVTFVPMAITAGLIVSFESFDPPVVSTAGKIVLPAIVVGGLALMISLTGLWLANIIRSYDGFKSGDLQYCFDSTVILKYGMIPFFIANLASVIVNHMVMLVAGHGTTLLLVPFTAGISVGATALYMIPGAVWGTQALTLLKKNGGISAPKALLFSVLQFIFVTDVLATAILAIKCFKRHKVKSIVVIVIYGIVLVGGVVLLAFGINAVNS